MTWNGYNCSDSVYKILVIESMDKDAETRRVGPVAILDESGKYLDLINGQQTYSKCTTALGECRKRLSTFIAVISPDKHYHIYFSNYAPNSLRLRLLNADLSFRARVGVYYITSNRIDLFKNDEIVYPTNANVDPVSKAYKLIDPGNDTLKFKPNISSPIGTNFINRTEKRLYFTIGGSAYIDLIVTQTLFIQFNMKDILPEEFYNSQDLVNNIAALLGVDKKYIRKIEPVKENRKGRDLDSGSTMLIVIENEPAQNYSEGVETFSSILTNITMKFASGSIEENAQKLLNTSIQGGFIELPSNSNETQSFKLSKISKIKLIRGPKSCREQSPCDQQPIIQVLDDMVFLVVF